MLLEEPSFPVFFFQGLPHGLGVTRIGVPFGLLVLVYGKPILASQPSSVRFLGVVINVHNSTSPLSVHQTAEERLSRTSWIIQNFAL